MSSAVYDASSLNYLLPIYYKRLFPLGPYCKWLSYGSLDKNTFRNREFSFTLDGDIYVRFLSYADQNEFEHDLLKKCPQKIDIGAIYTFKPKDRKSISTENFQPVAKELVFDIDMTDYDDVRNCCSGADICAKCWPLMVMAVKILNRALRDDFGFEHLLFVYSGRRGIHCWVCDERARDLDGVVRVAIAEYLSIVQGGENKTKKVTLHDVVHPAIKEALAVIDNHFVKYAIEQQDILGNEQNVEKVFALFPDDVREQLKEDAAKAEKKLGRKLSSLTVWRDIIKYRLDSRQGVFAKCGQTVNEIMLQYCYPRLDVNVSKGVNHLLKSPFCVHPKTGRVCVPIDASDVDNFNPLTVPTISQLCDEINALEKPADDSGPNRVKDYKRTSLKSYIGVFDTFLAKLEESRRGKRLVSSDMQCEF